MSYRRAPHFGVPALSHRRAPRYGVPAVVSLYLAALVVAIGQAPTPVAAYADGAPPGFSGGFGEQACDGCHFDAPINTKPGQLTLTGVPARFTPGERYTLTLTLSRPAMMIGGFQMTARLVNGGAQGGTLTAAPGEEKRIKIETQSNVQYANQRLDGSTLVEPGTAKWTLVWTAPATAGSVVFHAAANAANKDDATRGDYVYTATASSDSQ